MRYSTHNLLGEQHITLNLRLYLNFSVQLHNLATKTYQALKTKRLQMSTAFMITKEQKKDKFGM